MEKEWNNIEEFRSVYQEKIKEWNKKLDNEHCAVFNSDIPDTKEKWGKIKLIIVGDNPGQEEKVQNKYLIGPAGEIARNFINKKWDLNFEENVLVLNKTPIFTPTTQKLTGIDIGIRKETQEWMATNIVQLHQSLKCELWIIGMGQLNKGIFKTFKETFKKTFEEKNGNWDNVFVYKHFSCGGFFKDLLKLQGKASVCEIQKLGEEIREKIFIKPAT